MSDFPLNRSSLSRNAEDKRLDYHSPVMVDECVDAFNPAPGEVIVDGTLGGGGHTRALLRKGAKIIALDQDIDAIGSCTQHLVGYDGDSVRVVQANFRHLDQVLDLLETKTVDGVLYDIGVSSRQIDSADRGFSFQRPGPLDMRMDRRLPISAADIVNTYPQDELTRLFYLYGEEPAAKRAARAIVDGRQKAFFTDTLSLATTIGSVIPKRGPRHPATRVFQALRIAVNDELGALDAGLEAAARRLRPGGRLAVLTFHSLEDRRVKHFCRETSSPTLDRPEWPSPRRNPRCLFDAVTRKAVAPTTGEIARNPRARSAKLRVLARNSAVYVPPPSPNTTSDSLF